MRPRRLTVAAWLAPGLGVFLACGSGFVDVGTATTSSSPWEPGAPVNTDAACTPGSVRSCTAPPTEVGPAPCPGSQTCLALGDGTAWSACVTPNPVPEICGDGLDNDCDGAVDDGCPGPDAGIVPDAGVAPDAGRPICVPNDVRACTTGCGSTGQQACEATETWGPCRAGPERCDTPIDDDCDGQVNEGCDHKCEDTEGHACNGDLGYGDRCAPQDNTGGCTAARFQAWCNRRNPATPTLWDDYLKGWVAARCSGAITLVDSDGDGYFTYTCRNAAGEIFECTTPLVLQFAPGVPVAFTPAASSFPLQAGRRLVHDWPMPATPWLALDRNGNGRIDDAGELFGAGALLQSGGTAVNGFEALAALDANRDGRITPCDPAFGRLAAWRDVNRDGVSQPEEMAPLSQTGVVAIELGWRGAPRCDARGNCERERAAMRWRDMEGIEHRGEVVDVYLRGDVVSPIAAR